MAHPDRDFRCALRFRTFSLVLAGSRELDMVNDDKMKIIIDMCQLSNWGCPAKFIADKDDKMICKS